MNEVDRVWLATLIDCEGTIGLGRNVHKVQRADGSTRVDAATYSVLVCVNHTYFPLIERAALLMGGSTVQKRNTRRFGTKPCFTVWLRRRPAVLELLRDVEPYLMEKRALAQELISWLEWFSTTRVTPEGHRLSAAGKRAARPEYDRRADQVRAHMPQIRRVV